MSPLMAFAWHATRVGLFRRSRTRLWHVDIACVARYSNQKKKREREGENVSARVTVCVCVRRGARGAGPRAVCVWYSTVQYRPYHIYTQRRPTTDDAEEARAFLYPQRLFLSILASLARRATNHCD